MSSLLTLSDLLGIELSELENIRKNSDNMFFISKIETKKDGSKRYTFDVKPSLKKIHKKIKRIFLEKVIYPDYLQGSLKGKDYIKDAEIHLNSQNIITEDVKNFFPSISKDIVISVWKSVFHFPKDISEFLADLITYKGFLAQGAIPSSYICNLVLFKAESELVKKLEIQGFTYTRYVDDISISAKRPFSRSEKTEIIADIHSMLKLIGVKLNRKKHRIMPKNDRQEIHGINVNRRSVTLSKKVRDNIKAAVYQCEKEYEQRSKKTI
ncbi:reverse transcriptase family protein [Actinobacillus equuli]|uniref:reverse transcriptase family protein n=1 Tax=Actinobacillus equuli TaxID=718 RepID=UPI002442C3CE|nr:reverse transcriptase family protein [Actinobacillus equuli]WGE42119.1 reverse transcriptase family protein [Actinobacillus equuli subsp. haemolyticus]